MTTMTRPPRNPLAFPSAAAATGPGSRHPQPQPSDDRSGLVLGGALVTTALLAGLYYAFAVAVMPGLAKTSDETFVDAMQQVNEAIVNPAFMIAFLGAPVLTGIAAWHYLRRRGPGSAATRRGGRLIAAALVLHLIGLGLTAGANVPLNDGLAAAGNPGTADTQQLATAREAYEGPWTRRHLLRTGVTVAALGCLAGAALISSPRRRPETTEAQAPLGAQASAI